MILYVKTDGEAPAWLAYILDEFRRIHHAKFEIRIRPGTFSSGESAVIFYTADFFQGVNVPRRSEIRPGGKTDYLAAGLFIWRGTEAADPRFVCPYDLFRNAFIALSRLEEFEAEKNGTYIGSYAFRHPRVDKSTFDIPVVNVLFRRFKTIIETHFPSLPFGDTPGKEVEFSHDVDYLVKTPLILLKKTVFNVFNTLRGLARPGTLPANLKKTVSFPFTRPSYWGFDCLEEIEKQFNRRSVFYVYAGAGTKKSFKGRFIDPSYDVASNKGLQEKLRRLKSEGFEIGLHGSFRSALDGDSMKSEKDTLENVLNAEIKKTRQHWLNYRESITPYIHDRFFESDSTLGWNDRMGFRSGCASRYRPYDHIGQKPFRFFETPQFLMDSNIFDYGSPRQEKSIAGVCAIFDRVFTFENVCFSISWHTHSCNRDFPWHETYRELVRRAA